MRETKKTMRKMSWGWEDAVKIEAMLTNTVWANEEQRIECTTL